MIKVTKHIGYIDALKGLAAIMVFMGHFMLAFPLLQNLKGIPVIKEFVNGLFPVHTFILLAGFSLCCSLQNKDPQRSIATLVAKRYFRLWFLWLFLRCWLLSYVIVAGETINNGEMLFRAIG